MSFISDGTGSRFAVERSRKKRIADVVARPGEDKATLTRSQPELPAYPQCVRTHNAVDYTVQTVVTSCGPCAGADDVFDHRADGRP